jgi:hypothetical protein
MGVMIETEGRDERDGETECNHTGRYRTAAVNIHIDTPYLNGRMSIMEEAAPRGTTTRLSTVGRVLGARHGLIKHMSREFRTVYPGALRYCMFCSTGVLFGSEGAVWDE